MRLLLAVLVALTAAMAVEIGAFNLPFWRTLGASTDSAAASNVLGAGLERTDGGMLRVTDPTQAYLTVTADGTSPYARLDPAPPVDPRGGGGEASAAPARTMHVRVDASGRTGRVESVSTLAPRSLFLHAEGSGTLTVRFEEAKGTVLPVEAVRANVRVPFHVDWARVGVMLALVAAVALLQPASRLWRIRLDPSDRRQRAAWALCLLPVLVLAGVAVARQIVLATPLVFHRPYDYTYDFDQYGHVADALLAGRPWLDLPVPDGLARAADPQDVGVRDGLLARGVTPIYWDYAFHDGRWYSYFGVLPALLLFAPYRAVTSLFVPGGLMLPSAAAVTLLMAVFAVTGSLLVIRLLHRLAPRASLGSATVALAVFALGSNAPYLAFRTNFYSVPFAASLALTCLGLWLWLGADTSRAPVRQSDRWRVEGARPLSLPRLAAGSLCIAANIGCRPTFTLAALLAFPLFLPQIRALVRGLAERRLGVRDAVRAPLAAVLPAVPVAAAQLVYNAVRFGSPFDFGSSYQMTVTDMTRFHEPAADVPATVGYYLFLPWRMTDGFPWVALSPTPLPEWGYREPMVAGLFALCPFLLAVVALPFLRRRPGRPGVGPLPASMVALAAVLLLFDTCNGGLGWRYIADFGWLVALAALPPLAMALDGVRSPATRAARLSRAAVRGTALVLLLACVALTVLSCFTPGRSDQLIAGDPGLYHAVEAWFRLP